ncbi:TetR/AcrR family transcriptional regulator [Henriciella marina]|jgi:AcrR family transcriptional regulator|uniref:Helix-turn-helix domain containing protein n=1 Tax=Henriciella marina TaxID=453851 RepID=A0ABT4LQU1_9PROT|nr:TetR/AcrR family transcriptional regulator [Henriciella marina]MCZ4296704.1 helix-turn-helix domain containing protein [Henriciella marina]
MVAAARPAQGQGKRARTKAANRQAILEAARQVFARLGAEATTVRDIIRETDLAAGTFYNYFKSKEEVFEALADEGVRRFRPRLASIRENASSLQAYLLEAYSAYFDFLNEENEEALRHGAPHAAMIGVRVDTPEMQAVFEEIRADLEQVAKSTGLSLADSGYLTAAAIGIAREVGDHMLMRRPVDTRGATEFATQLFLHGAGALASKRNS